MISRLFLVLLLAAIPSLGETPTYSPGGPDDSRSIAALHRAYESGQPAVVERFWKDVARDATPLIESIPGNKDYSFVTFLWQGNAETKNVVIFDGVAGFDAKDRMLRLDETNVWYKTYKVRNDARFAYNLSPNDPLTSFDEIKGDDEMRNRLAMLQVDPLNPRRCPTTFGAYGAESSYIELPDAVRLVWNTPTPEASKGKVEIATIPSGNLKGEKKLWIYTPVGYSPIGNRYPLLVLFDGDRNVMWIPNMLDNLIAQKQIPPMVAVLIDDSIPSARRTELPANPLFADFLAKELVPWSREKYHTTTDATRTVVAGSSYGGLAAVFAGLRHPEVFGNVVSLSGSFWWKPDGVKEGEWHTRLVASSPALPLRFYLEVGLMEGYPMQIAANRHMRDALIAKGYPLHYSEFDGGHSFLTWSGGMANSLMFLIGQKKLADVCHQVPLQPGDPGKVRTAVCPLGKNAIPFEERQHPSTIRVQMTRDEILERLQTIRIKAGRALQLLESQPLPADAQAEIQDLVIWVKDELETEYRRMLPERVQRAMTLFELSVYSPTIEEAWTGTGIRRLRTDGTPNQRWYGPLEAVIYKVGKYVS